MARKFKDLTIIEKTWRQTPSSNITFSLKVALMTNQE